MTDPAPILIYGVNNMTKALGVSQGKLRGDYLKRRDFSARREESGAWVTSRQALIDWAGWTFAEAPNIRRPWGSGTWPPLRRSGK